MCSFGINNLFLFFLDDPKPFIDGVRINSPHYLSKLTVPANTTERFTLVVSQYEKMNTIFYTLRAYSTNPFTLKKIGSPLEHKKV
jgi:calpain-7